MQFFFPMLCFYHFHFFHFFSSPVWMALVWQSEALSLGIYKSMYLNSSKIISENLDAIAHLQHTYFWMLEEQNWATGTYTRKKVLEKAFSHAAIFLHLYYTNSNGICCNIPEHIFFVFTKGKSTTATSTSDTESDVRQYPFNNHVCFLNCSLANWTFTNWIVTDVTKLVRGKLQL